jgi:rare lipoprotein A (peptidoglycan hydrolase)
MIAGIVGAALTAVLAISAYGAAQSPTRAAAAPAKLPQGAIGLGVDYAPSASPVSGASLVGEKAVTSKTSAFTKTAKKKNAVDRKALAKKRAAAKAAAAKRAAAARAAKSRRVAAKRRAASRGGWRTAYCSTFGIGDGLIGSGLAGGGTLRSDSMIVAHKTLAFGTKIRFKYNGRTCTAIVKDRGPYIDGREFDLGPGTAKALGFDGVGNVKYQIL